jgi:hypothetical protein
MNGGQPLRRSAERVGGRHPVLNLWSCSTLLWSVRQEGIPLTRKWHGKRHSSEQQ